MAKVDTHMDIPGTPYSYEKSLEQELRELSERVEDMRSGGRLSPEVLHGIRKFFRLKNIYHSNAIEGNQLDVGETRQVVELGLTITGKPLKDQAEARNLSEALDFLEVLAKDADKPITEHDMRQLHHFVLKGIDDAAAGAYRTVPVEISGSEFPPPGPESVPGEMQDFADWFREASVLGGKPLGSVSGLLAAAAAHTWFVSIHPFIDGNGRVARLLLNLILMRHGFPIAIISKEDRFRYYDALEESQGSDLTPFTGLLAECIDESLEEYERAAEEQRERTEWVQSLAQKFTQPERVRAENEYEVWRNAMELLKSHLRQTANDLNENLGRQGEVFFKDFGHLEFEKYAAFRSGESAKRTWFFRIDFWRGEASARYLFFFGFGSPKLRRRCADATLHVAREDPPKSYRFERLDRIDAPNLPNLLEIGYEMSKERFVARKRGKMVAHGRIEGFGKQFFNDVVEKHFGA